VRKFILLSVVAAFIAMAATAGAANGSWDRVKGAGKLVLGLDDAFPLMGYRDADGRLSGFDIDLAGEVCRRLGVAVEWRPTRWDGIVHALNDGRFDAIWNGMTITEERARVVAFTRPYLMGGQIAVVRNDDRRFRRLQELKGVTVGAVSGAPGMKALEELPHAPKAVVAYENIPAALAGLAAGSLDAVVADCMPVRDALAKQTGRFRVIAGHVRKEPFGVAFRRDEKELRDRVQRTLDGLRKDGTMAKLSRKWFGEDLTNPRKW
jgi:polar amino acid transport system substrate-binding protein